MVGRRYIDVFMKHKKTFKWGSETSHKSTFELTKTEIEDVRSREIKNRFLK